MYISPLEKLDAVIVVVVDTPPKLAGEVKDPVLLPSPSKYLLEKLEVDPLKARAKTIPTEPAPLDLIEYFKTKSV
jgi:hypothetical protein